MIKNIIFDVGMVLVDFRWQEYMKDLGFSKETVEILGKELVLSPLWNELDLGIRREEDVIEEMRNRLPEYKEETKLFFENIEDIVESYPYAKDWIHELKGKGYQVYLLSNYPVSLFTMHEKRKFTFLEELDGKIVSGFVKLAKPNPKIYETLLTTYDLKAEECLFIDDRLENIEAAKKLGMEGILFNGYEEARKAMEKFC